MGRASLSFRAKGVKALMPHAAVLAVIVVAAAVVWISVALTSPGSWFVDDTKYRDEIVAASRRHGLDPDLVRALVFRESRFNPRARGSRGEVGLMQVLPGGAAADWARIKKRPRPSVRELYDVGTNLEIGCWYLARAMRRWSGYRGNIALALAQYNAGESRAKAWAPEKRDGEVVPRIRISSTKKYVETILKRYRKYLRERSKNKTAGGK